AGEFPFVADRMADVKDEESVVAMDAAVEQQFEIGKLQSRRVDLAYVRSMRGHVDFVRLPRVVQTVRGEVHDEKVFALRLCGEVRQRDLDLFEGRLII